MQSTQIATLLQLGAEAMAAKQYELAVDHYSQLCQLKNIENEGTDDPDCMFLYGKALFENAVANSDVLGGAGKKENPEEAADKKTKDDTEPVFSEQLAEEEEVEEDDSGAVTATAAEGDSSDEEVPFNEGDEDENEDDFSIAWEILDLTRVLYETKLEFCTKSNPLPIETPYFQTDKLAEIEKTLTENDSLHITKKLADTFDLLGELSLETENFNQATNDFQRMLDLKLSLYPFYSGQVTEAYFKISLAWEFNSIDPKAISNAIDSMESAIRSIVTRTVMAKKTGEHIDTDLIGEMKARLIDLKSNDLQIKEEKNRIMKGIMGEISTESDIQPSKEVKVNDLSGMVKKRKAPSSSKMIKKVKK